MVGIMNLRHIKTENLTYFIRSYSWTKIHILKKNIKFLVPNFLVKKGQD